MLALILTIQPKSLEVRERLFAKHCRVPGTTDNRAGRRGPEKDDKRMRRCRVEAL